MDWTTVRVFAGQAAEGTAAPAAGLFVQMATFQNVIEFRFDEAAVANAPTSVTFWIWRSYGGRIDHIDTLTLLATDLVNPETIEVYVGGGDVYVTVASFEGGAVPTVTCTVEARCVTKLGIMGSLLKRIAANGTALLGDVATAANQVLQIALEGTIRQTTTPSRANAATGRIECDAAAVSYIGASLRHVRRIALSSGLATSAASLAEGSPCNALKCDTDDVRIYAQGPESPLIASQSGADWTGAAGWSRVGNVWTHAAAGGVGDLEITPAGASAIAVGETYAVVFTLAWTGGTSLTAKLGTGAGTARSSSATFVELVTSATNGKLIFTPTNDADCSVDVSAVYVIANLGPQASNAWEPTAAIKIVGVAADATPATPHATAKVWAAWYRRPAAVEVT